ncbi:unnamed protein product, partial [Trichobilharzia regenti]
MHNHINPSSELFNKEISTEKELSIGYTELKTQNNSSTVNTWKNINNNNNNNNSAHPHDKFNLWPAPVSQPSHIIHPFYSNGSNKLDDLELPFTPVANKKMSVHQNENAKKRKMNIQSFQNKMQSKYAGQCSFKWTPTCQIDKGTPNTMTEKSMNTPLVQRSMLDYLKINNKISKSEPSKKHNPIEEMKKTFTPNTTVDADNSSRRSNRKRFKWDPNSQTSMDLDSSESLSTSTFTLMPVLGDNDSVMDTTLNITNMLMKDTTPELINRSFAPRKNDPLSMSCPPISSSSKLNQFKYSPTSFNKNNTSIQSDTGSEIDISPSPHNHSYDSNTSKPNYHPINYNDRIQRDGLKSNSSSSVSLPATDYYSTPKTAHNYLCYTKGINSQNNGSNSSSSSSIVTTQSILTPVMNSNEQHKFKIPSYSVVLKSSQTNKSRMKFNSFTPTETITRSDNTNTNLRKRLIQHSINHGVDDSQWDESQESSIQEKLQQQDQHL